MLWGYAVCYYFVHWTNSLYLGNYPTEIYANQDIIDADILVTEKDKNRWKVPTKLFNDSLFIPIGDVLLSVYSVQWKSTNQLLTTQWCVQKKNRLWNICHKKERVTPSFYISIDLNLIIIGCLFESIIFLRMTFHIYFKYFV